MKKSELQKIIREEVRKATNEGKLTVYLDPKQKEALISTTQKVNELMAAMSEAAKMVSITSRHKEIYNWLEMSKQELLRIQARLNQIDLD